MSEEIKKENNQAAPETPESSQPNLSRKRRTALVGYMAILFAVAFLLVALSMVIENKRLQSSKQQIEDKSAQTSASLNGKISELQASYDALQKTSAEQQKQIDALTPEAERVPELEQAVEALTAERDTLSQEQERLQTEAENLRTEKETLESEVLTLRGEKAEWIGLSEKAAEVQELLYQAVEADEHGRWDKLKDLLTQIEPNKELLCPTALEVYESLAID